MAEEEDEKMEMSSATLKVRFVWWKKPPKRWGSWVQNMCSLHQSTWKKAGIYEAIMSSTYPIKRHDDLILELASRWCSQTNTLVFQWGEATLTLEDMLVLGGFSPLGVSALTSVGNDAKLLEIKEGLDQVRKEIQRSRSNMAVQGKWMKKFMESGSDLEHSAFLTMWLSRFVFPVGCTNRVINRRVLDVAVRLSRGIKIALGPVVLAMLYRDLNALTKWRRFSQVSGDNNGHLNLCNLFHLVQIWAWERFPLLKPVPDCMYSGENFPRLARWSNVKIMEDKDLRCAIDSAEKAFLWCPYGLFVKREGRDVESFGQCIKERDLLGFDSCIERYQPQRVARQFGTLLSPILQVKVENAVDCGPPGFPNRIEVINIDDSDSDSDFEFDSDDDCNVTMTELLKLPVAETRSPNVDKTEDSERADEKRSSPIKSAAIKREDYEDCVNPHGFATEAKLVIIDDSDEDNEKNNDGQSVSLQFSNLGSLPSDNESNEEMDVVKGSVHETSEDEKEEVAYTNHDDIEGGEVRNTSRLRAENGLAMSCDAESYTNERSKGSESLDFDLEARINRLENIVYMRIKVLEAAQH